jgi:hypothetical protein
MMMLISINYIDRGQFVAIAAILWKSVQLRQDARWASTQPARAVAQKMFLGPIAPREEQS